MAAEKPFNIGIVGGGISGLTLAIGLRQNGVPVTIYEQAPHFGEIGAGVAFGPNAARAMRLMSPKVYEAFDKCKTTNMWDKYKDTWFTARVGDARKAGKDGYVKPGQKVDEAWFDIGLGPQSNAGGVYRAHFLDDLVKQVPDGVAKFGKKLDTITEATDGSGDSVLRFEDGTTAQHNAVIGCDGIKSRVREWLLGRDDPAARPVFSGKYAYRGLIPMDKATELLGEEVAQNSNLIFGYHGHMLTFPVEKGKTMNVVAFSSRETWDDPRWVVSATKEEMETDFEGWGPTVRTIVREMQKPDVWALFMHPPASTYYKGRVCLLGDAAHATTPHQGAGAGMCIEDALVLSRLLNEAKSADDLERVFGTYDEVRRSRTQRNVTTSKEAGQLYDFELEGDDLDLIEKNFNTRMDWIWHHDIEEELERARTLYRAASAKI